MTHEDDGSRARAGLDDPVKIPFIFVPSGSDPPADWLAEHPGAIRIPAKMVPRANAASGQTDWRIDLARPPGDPLPPPGRAGMKPYGAPASIAPIGGPSRRKPSIPPDLRGSEDPIRAALRTYKNLIEERVPAARQTAQTAEAAQSALTYPDCPQSGETMKLKEARISAFLHLLRWLENTSVSDVESYRQRAGNPHDSITDAEMLNYAPKPENIVLKVFSKDDGRWHPTPRKSTAAGAYQIVWKTWLDYARKLKLTDFTPANQNAVARAILSDYGALPDIQEGHIKTAIKKLKSQWSSLPGGSQAHHDELKVLGKYRELLMKEMDGR